jgi:NAD(P)-dependent dehydrogenase (short-subunit alcohol dehydrogenase family)
LFDVAGRSALITGATGAFGKAAAHALAAAGVRLTLAGGNAQKLDAVESELRSDGAEVITVVRRPQSEEDAAVMVEAAVGAYDGLDIVVTASGMNKVAKITEQSPDEWQSVMDANVKGSWLVCRAAGRQMIDQQRGGKLVLVSSTRGKLGHPAGYGAYCPSKAAVDLLAKTLACEWGPHRINVNAIGPTVFRSDLTEWMYSQEDPGKSVREAMLSRIPLGRLGEPDDFAGAVLFFSSRASDFCTGQTLYVDGGYTAG